MHCTYDPRSLFRSVSTFVAAALVLAALTGPKCAFAQEEDREIVDQMVAVVNGEMITMYDMNMAMQPILGKFKGKVLSAQDEAALNEYRRQYLDRMIDDILIKQDAEKWQIEVSDREVDAEIEAVKQRNHLDDAGLAEQLKYEEMTLDEYRKNVRDGLLKHRILGGRVQRKVVVTEDEIRAEYEKNKGEYGDGAGSLSGPGRSVNVSIIILSPAQSGTELKRRIDAGELSFAEAAKEYSIGPSAEQGGDLGKMAWRDLAPQWQEVLSKLNPGDVSTPFVINEHEALLMLTPGSAPKPAAAADTASDPDAGYEAAKDQIYARLYQQKLEALFQEYLQKLRSTAVVDKKI